MLETFGERLANTIVTTDLMIGNWDPEKGAKINVRCDTLNVSGLPFNLFFFISQVDPWTFFQETDENKLGRIVTLRRRGVRNQGIPFGKPNICSELTNVAYATEPPDRSRGTVT